ncbi:MAG: hypothetical protein IPF58_08820 [Saprospirales bacterium]|nr:hypothetical protein [Saprospirales bacterium]
MFLIGIGKGDITAFFKGVGLLGYGLPHHLYDCHRNAFIRTCFHRRTAR